ncbi:hypothetical protein RMSM_04617 [Rhodopirellula maiorica SM1]|uniref:Uncharacterized protein n=1 Tax=Rhodopirellula maiorica SM1 TaxID=1265738 RepID=M5RGL2_9BACT|nr:hypothetical protein RMSM_04617 [Rhodopirellula maiorica SM1]
MLNRTIWGGHLIASGENKRTAFSGDFLRATFFGRIFRATFYSGVATDRLIVVLSTNVMRTAAAVLDSGSLRGGRGAAGFR